ncbi:Lrp/AsnC family transcriptional regulator [uncultured Sulfitobacter sp.]|uniref:Lrp/AsnC family transcriptional regulator n=1 Tax=uncultured Sulfitobacter sp. TaxID=191468 RepID=UPI002604A706|nr:Lrp/AsnC family transcriptional regulator [uncultured Sulfitobacter sp.]
MQSGKPSVDEDDRKILREVQRDCTRALDRIAERVGLSRTTVWNRMQKLVESGTILRQAAIIDPRMVGLDQTFFITIRTSRHDIEWLETFRKAVTDMPQITEAHRLAGTTDYLLKVQVASTEAFDSFYKDLVSRIPIFDVSSSLSMETMKRSLDLEI